MSSSLCSSTTIISEMESAAAENVKSKGDQRLAYLLLGKFSYVKPAKMDYNRWKYNWKIVCNVLSILFCVLKLVILKVVLMWTKSP